MPRKKSERAQDPAGWHTVRTKTIFESAHLELTQQEVLTPTRRDQPLSWTVVHRAPAVVIAPVTVAGKYVLLRQERIPVRAALWEFPAGQIDDEDSADATVIRDTAIRELREETGYELPAGGGGELIALGYFFTSQGFTDELCHLFLARGVVLADAGAAHDEDEGILGCAEFTAAELTRMIAEGEIVNANALSLYARLAAAGLL